MKTIDMLINEIKSCEELQKLLAEAAKKNALTDFLNEQGCEAAAEEFIAALKAQTEELDDDALDAVAGGANHRDVIESMIANSMGISCVIEATDSAQGSGVGNGPDGNILCND